MSGYFNEETIIELAKVAKSEGWEVMVKDAYTFVDVDCDWSNTEDKHMLAKALIKDVCLFYKLNTNHYR